MSGLAGKAAVVGIGQTEFSKESGRSELQLASEAVRTAVADAGLTPADIDGLVTFQQDENDELALMRSVGIREVRWTSRTPFGGGGASATVEHAAAAVASGAADAVVIYRAFNERSGRRFGQPSGRPSSGTLNLYLPYGLDTPSQDLLAVVPALHARLRADQRGFRSVFGGRPGPRRHEPQRLVLRPTDHPRRPSVVAVDRRADPAPARLLPGERRRGGARRHPHRPGPRSGPAGRGGRRGGPGQHDRRRRDVQTTTTRT